MTLKLFIEKEVYIVMLIQMTYEGNNYNYCNKLDSKGEIIGRITFKLEQMNRNR